MNKDTGCVCVCGGGCGGGGVWGGVGVGRMKKGEFKLKAHHHRGGVTQQLEHEQQH